jgi:hypothetical protein
MRVICVLIQAKKWPVKHIFGNPMVINAMLPCHGDPILPYICVK